MEHETIQTEDLACCAQIFVEVFNRPPWNENWAIPSALRRLTEIAGTPGFTGLKVVADGRPIGFAMGYIESFDDGGDFYLKEMCILPEFQRKGIGTDLLKQLKTRLLQAGARKLYLLTERGGRAARFYEKNGFYTSDRMIVMGRRLNPEADD
jgi:GNAT superfamily N-acetyltransferase